MIFVLLMLCGCSTENSDTRFMLDTAVTLIADCDEETLNEAFRRCSELEKLLSRELEGSDVARINAGGETAVSKHTETLLRRALYYSEISNGRFDVTIYPLSTLWDFKNQAIPSRDEIAEALKSVDYESVKISEGYVDAGGAKIDLGGIAKGYIADRLLDFFKKNGVKQGRIDLGGNLIFFGNREYTVGIKEPFSENALAATLKVKNKSVVTSGIYERSFESDGQLYHHILDPETGYPAKTDLFSATVIGDSSMDCDALATVCVLLGKQKATALIESTPDTEAIFIDESNKIYHTSGIEVRGNQYSLK